MKKMKLSGTAKNDKTTWDFLGVEISQNLSPEWKCFQPYTGRSTMHVQHVGRCRQGDARGQKTGPKRDAERVHQYF